MALWVATPAGMICIPGGDPKPRPVHPWRKTMHDMFLRAYLGSKGDPMMKMIDESKRFFAALEEDVPRVKTKTTERVVYASCQAVRGDNVVDGVHRLARAVDELQLRYGILGFLAECSVIQLAGRDALRAIPGVTQDVIDKCPEVGPYAVFSFITLKEPCHVREAQEWLASQGLGGIEGAIGTLKI